MTKSTAIYFLIATSLLISRVSSKPSQTRELQFQTQNPIAVSIGSRLYVISKNQTHIRVDSSDKNYAPCVVAVDPIEHEISGRIKATVLESQKIVVYGVHNDSEVLMIKSVFHTILIVDPWRCELTTMKGLIEDKVPIFFPVINAEIIGHKKNQFDIFYTGPKECAPCRFDDEGRRIELKRQITADIKSISDFHLKQFGQNGDYVYGLILHNGSTVLRVLDQDFKVLNQFAMNNSFFDVSTSPGAKKSFVGLTYNTPDSPYIFFYTLFNSNLQPIFTKQLDEIEKGYIGLNTFFNIDLNGNSFISFQQMSVEEGDYKVSLIGYDSSGKEIGSSFVFAEIPYDASYDIQTLIVDDRKYCLIIHKFGEPFDETKIKCIDITNRA